MTRTLDNRGAMTAQHMKLGLTLVVCALAYPRIVMSAAWSHEFMPVGSSHVSLAFDPGTGQAWASGIGGVFKRVGPNNWQTQALPGYSGWNSSLAFAGPGVWGIAATRYQSWLEYSTAAGTATAWAGRSGACSLAFKSDGKPAISHCWMDRDGSGLHGVQYSEYNGVSWVLSNVPGDVSGSTSLAIDATDRPWIAFTTPSSSQRVARYTGSQWVTYTVNASAANGNEQSLALAPNGLPAVATLAYVGGHTEGRLAKYDGSAWVADSQPFALNAQLEAALTFDPTSGRAVVAYIGTDNGLWLARQTVTGWTQERVHESAGRYVNIACSSEQIPAILHGQTYSFAPQQPPTVRISGQVRTTDIVGIEGVLLSADNGGGSATTSSSGHYELTVPYNWSGTVTPTALYSSFEPERRTYPPLTADQLWQHYTATEVSFRPSKDGFHFANWGLDWSVEIPIPGHCLGMTYASLQNWVLGIDPIPDCSLPPSSEEQRQSIVYHQLMATMATKPTVLGMLLWPANKGTWVRENYEIVRAAILDGLPCPVLLMGDLLSGHAVLAYKIEQVKSLGQVWIYIYDPNEPCCPPATDCDLPHIEIEDGQPEWEMLTYSGYNRFAAVHPHPDPVDQGSALAFVVRSPVTLEITDPDGLIIDENHSQIADARYLMRDYNGDGQPEERVVITAPKIGAYSVRVVPKPLSAPTDTFTLEVMKFGVMTALAENVAIQDIPTVPYVATARMRATADIRGASCPNPLNLQSRGKLPIAMLGSGDFDVSMVDLATVRLARVDGVGRTVVPLGGPPGPRPVLEDVGRPAGGNPCDCHEEGPDEIADCVLKFSTPEVVAALSLNEVAAGTSVELVVSGNLVDGTAFTASDCVKLVPVGDPER